METKEPKRRFRLELSLPEQLAKELNEEAMRHLVKPSTYAIMLLSESLAKRRVKK